MTKAACTRLADVQAAFYSYKSNGLSQNQSSLHSKNKVQAAFYSGLK